MNQDQAVVLALAGLIKLLPQEFLYVTVPCTVLCNLMLLLLHLAQLKRLWAGSSIPVWYSHCPQMDTFIHCGYFNLMFVK